MRLSEAGELGAPARAGVARPDRRGPSTMPRSSRTASSSRRTRSSRASTSGSTGSPGASSGSAPQRSTSATWRPLRPGRRRCSSPSPRRPRSTSSRWWSSTRASPRRACRCAAATRPARTEDRRQRHGGRPSERVPGRTGARPGDAVVVTGPLGAAGAAFRAGRLPAAADPDRGGSSARLRRERDARRLGRPRRRRRPHRAPLRLPPRDRPRRGAARRHPRRPRLRRGLRAARRHRRPAPASR